MQQHPRILFPTKPPLATVIVLVGCLIGFVVELCLGNRLGEFLLTFGIVPIGLKSYFDGVPGATFRSDVLPFFSSLFLHGGYIHLLANLSYLWVVGDFVEDWLGKTRFLVLLLFGAAAELIVRIGLAPVHSGLPSVGISGAIASLIGAFLVILAKLQEKEEHASAATRLRQRLPVTLGLLAWFPVQLLNRYFSIAATTQTREPVSWPALFAAFLLGMFLLSLTGRRIAPASAEAPALPKDEGVPALGA